MRIITIASLLLVLPMTLNAQDFTGLPAVLVDKINKAQQACAAVDNGQFYLEWGGVIRTDLDGDLNPDWVLDESAYSCSTAVSMYCGTGGCLSHFLVGSKLASFQNQGWTINTSGDQRVLLLSINGSQCGGMSTSPCVLAQVWDKETKQWRSVQQQEK